MQAVITHRATSMFGSGPAGGGTFQVGPAGVLLVDDAGEEAVGPDPIVDALNAILQTASDRRARPCALFVRSIERAIQAHLAHEYGAARTASLAGRRGLTRSQERRAKQFLATAAGEYLPIARVAEACALSRNYFIKAFKETTGETPHRWRSRFRVEQAKGLLLGDRSIAEIALDCGFADQSHLTRVFAKVIGLPPGVWRRKHRGGVDDLLRAPSN